MSLTDSSETCFKMDMDDIDTCKVCMENYNEVIRPRGLSCGHSFCTDCLDSMLEDGKLSCPKCLQTHFAKTSQAFSINYDLEEMILKFREAHVSITHLPSSRSLSSNMQIFLEEQIDNAESLLRKSDEFKTLLDEYKNLLPERMTRHRELLPKLNELVSRNQDTVSALEKEHARLTETEGDVEILKKELRANLKQLENEQSISAADDLDKSYVALEDKVKNVQEDLLTASVLPSSDQLLKATTAALEAMKLEHDCNKSEVSSIFGSLSANVDKLMDIEGCHAFSLKRLLRRSDPTKDLLKENRIYAVCEQKGFMRRAKVSFENNSLYLHYLKDGEPPKSSYILKQSELVGTLASDSVTAFLDLAWDGVTQGRVHILLHPNTPLANHFRILCTGEKGPSYANCQLLEVVYKGDPTSQGLRFGDYEFNCGKGGAALVTGIDLMDEQYRRPHDAGIVWASFMKADGLQTSQFTITTGSYSGNFYERVFGIVEEGLEVVKSAATVKFVSDVVIVDCGVVLPQNS